MRRPGIFGRFLFCALLLLPALTAAQDGAKTLRIGWLSPGSAASQTVLLDVLRWGLREIGYVEGKNLVIETRWADGNLDRMPQLAKELAASKVAVIVTVFTATAIAAKRAVSDVPIVFTLVSDPLAAGLVQDLARPGGNVTGLASLNIELAPKRLEILHEILPAVTRYAFFYRSDQVTDRAKLEAATQASRKMGVQLLPVDLLKISYAEAFERAAAAGVKGASMVLNPSSFDNRRIIADLAAKHRIAAIYEMPVFVADGGLISYSVSQYAQIGRAAVYIDKIHKGAHPRDLPVEQAATLEMVINLKQAKALGIRIPTAIAMRADRLIE
jgi:putative ABC transport system substrate-binding protein